MQQIVVYQSFPLSTISAMSALAANKQQFYQTLVQQALFVEYHSYTTNIEDIETLHLSSASVHDIIVLNQVCQTIKHLSISNNAPSQSILPLISQNPSIQSLSIKSLKSLSTINFRPFSHLKKLFIGKIKQNDVKIISKGLPQLESLGEISDGSQSCTATLSSLKHLKELKISFYSLDYQEWGSFCDTLCHLESLSIQHCEMWNLNLETITEEFKELRCLRLYQSKITQRGFASLSRLSKLETLHIINEIKEQSVKAISKLPSLKDIKLTTDLNFIPLLSNLIKLEVRSFVPNCFDTFIDIFARNPQLQQFRLTNSNLGIQNSHSRLGQLMAVTLRELKLLELNVVGEMDDVGCYWLARMGSLTRVRMRRCMAGHLGAMKVMRNRRGVLAVFEKNWRWCGGKDVVKERRFRKNCRIFNVLK